MHKIDLVTIPTAQSSPQNNGNCAQHCSSALMTFIVPGETSSALKMHQKLLAAGLRPDPLGELTALPHTH